MKNVAKRILNFLNNNHTKVEYRADFKGNYYSYITDTVYISKDLPNKKIPKEARNINPKAGELITICHECLHSVQSKCLHITNVVFSNISIVLIVIGLFLRLFSKFQSFFGFITVAAILASVIIRTCLEIDAINRSTQLAKEVIKKDIVSEVSIQDIEMSKEYINKHKVFAILGMIKDKLIMLLIAALMIII